MSDIFYGNRGSQSPQLGEPTEVCLNCGYTAMAHSLSEDTGEFRCPLTTAAVNRRLAAAIDVSRELLSPLSQAFMGGAVIGGSTEPLSRRYKAIIRQQQAREVERQREMDAERERQAERDRQVTEQERVKIRRSAQVKAIQQKIDRGQMPAPTGGQAFAQPSRAVLRESFLQQAVIQVTQLFESWNVSDLCSEDDIMGPALGIAEAYMADYDRDEDQARVWRRSAELMVREAIQRKLAQKTRALGTEELDFSWPAREEPPTRGEPQRRQEAEPQEARQASRSYFDED